ncbi:MAG TPA: hypothetical protein ENN41_01755 [Sediminispirochaeta sp.]|nr:hypothetical protein [Sediminispirochaeta sp.]
MTRRLNYENDIFVLHEAIRLTHKSLLLPLDGTFFEGKIHHDIVFFNDLLSQLFRNLSSNHLLPNRPQNLRFLNRAKRLYCDLLSELLNAEKGTSLDLFSHFEEYKKYNAKQEQEIRAIRELLLEESQQDAEDELISSEEYKFLFES